MVRAGSGQVAAGSERAAAREHGRRVGEALSAMRTAPSDSGGRQRAANTDGDAATRQLGGLAIGKRTAEARRRKGEEASWRLDDREKASIGEMVQRSNRRMGREQLDPETVLW